MGGGWQARRRRVALALFGRGFVAMLPLWAGAIPSGIAYGLAAQVARLGPGEAQLMSVVVFSAAAQVSAVALLGAGAPLALLLGTTLALNAQLPLLSLSVGRQLRLSWPQRLLAAFFLTDGAYGIAATRGRLRLPVLLGAGVSMFAGWNLGTLLGGIVGHSLPDSRRLGLDFVVTLSFLAVLVPLLRSRAAALVALVAGATALVLVRLVPGGVVVLGAGLAGSAAGAWATRQERGAVASAAAAPGEVAR